ncbi:FAD-dependent oxidoreductase [Streptomyces sp. NBC_01549]|uniref:NAD(P)/FAD-dependent oxidoreductase n=1 Tax=Streptomyces sp. NBC_01549 TaxID=2975874 RepID=UPI00224D7A1F|nr:FAD-dependent oxidoreductase [Streptomyces sp. NBC_01549]MCX4588245.1 FAD-dependent oxidoreductase [Streptomyces sp. NBC_01549]
MRQRTAGVKMSSRIPQHIVIVGASLAGISAAQSLRTHGYTGKVTVIGDEIHQPYDRPPLSKDFLLGTMEEADLSLIPSTEEGEDIEWRLGTPAVGLDADDRPKIHLGDGRAVVADVAILATGARARALPVRSDLRGVFTLRGLSDAVALRHALAMAKKVVVVGAGFIGAEVASSAVRLGLEVTVVEATRSPLANVLGTELGALCAAQHHRNGVRLMAGVTVEELIGDDCVEGVIMSDDTFLPADVVVVGVGATPNVEWAVGSGLSVDNGFLTDASFRTNRDNVYAVGDCARVYDEISGAHVRHEHWSSAAGQGNAVARVVLGLPPLRRPAPYFWSHQYGHMLQYAGRHHDADHFEIVEGDPAAGKFVACFSDTAGKLKAVFAMDSSKVFAGYRRTLG